MIQNFSKQFPDNFQIYEDRSGNLWFSSNKGVKKMEMKGGKFTQSTILDLYTKDDGLSTHNILDFVLKGNKLFAGSDFGISQIQIEVEPLWWREKWMKWTVVIVGVLLLLDFFYYNYLRLKKKYVQKIQNEKKLVSLELQVLRSQMNPHFVFNSLNAIQYYIQRNEVELSENYLTRFSKLIRMFFDYSERQTIGIREEIKLLENYLEIEKMRFEDKISYTVNCDESLLKENPQIPSMLLQPIVEEFFI